MIYLLLSCLVGNTTSEAIQPVASTINLSTFSSLGFGYRLDFFTHHQQLPYAYVSQTVPFTIGDDLYLAVAVTGKSYTYCSQSVIMKWNKELDYFEEDQILETANAEKMKVVSVGDATYLFVLNQYEGCKYVNGKLYWSCG